MAISDLRKIEVRHRHTRNWLWYITAISFVTGALLAASIRTQREWRVQIPGLQSWRPESIMAQYKASQATIELQKRELESLRATVTKYEEAAVEGNRSHRLVNDELQRAKVLMGLSELKGRGIILTLNDSAQKPLGIDPSDAEMFILHDYDLQRVVNELYVAGAEAISINGQRLVGRTAIRCVGPVAHINHVPVAPPFVIQAIGDPAVLKSGLEIRGGIIDGLLKPLGFAVDIKASPEIHIPAYTGALELRFAQVASPKDGGSGEGKKR